MHFSQHSSAIRANSLDPDLISAHLTGFITAELLQEQLERLEASWDRFPAAVVVDLRQVSGYGSGVPSLARRWLHNAQSEGVERIALIASSSVLRTTAHVLSEGLEVQLRCFLCEDTARTWARGRVVSSPTPKISGNRMQRGAL
jgi:hypothetical protein